jgi:hypothetical protein
MKNEYSIIKLEECNFEVLIPLMQNCFGMDVEINYFEWKFKNNPAGFAFGFYAQHENGEIAAYYGVIPEIYYFDGVKKTIYQSCDTMTHSNHRRKGLFQKLALHCYQKLEEQNLLFIIGFGGGQSTPGFLKFGWYELFKMRYYFYPKFFKSKKKINFMNIEEIQDFTKIENLLQKSNKPSKIHSEKNSKTYCWRVSNPLHEYKTIAYFQEGVYNSFLTYYVEEDKLIIFDFYFLNTTSGKQLLNFVKSKLNDGHKGIISFQKELSENAKILTRHGFLYNPFKFGPLNIRTPFIIYSDKASILKYNNQDYWNISSFDHDSL